MSKWTRWWHCWCRLTPSEATSPVTSTRTGAVGELEVARRPAAARRRGRPPCRTANGVVPQPQPRGQLAAQPVQGGDPLGEHARPGSRCPGRRRSPAGGRPARRTWPSRCRPLRAASSPSRVERLALRRSCSSPCRLPESLSRASTVSTSAAGEERNALASVHGKSCASRTGDRRRALRRVQPGGRQLVARRRPRPAFAATARTAGSGRSAHSCPTSRATSG